MLLTKAALNSAVIRVVSLTPPPLIVEDKLSKQSWLRWDVSKKSNPWSAWSSSQSWLGADISSFQPSKLGKVQADPGLIVLSQS